MAYPTQSSWQPKYYQGQTGQGAPALPQGWEARYDPNYRRYYFINHITKETTWNDPRIRQAAPSSTPTATAQTTAAKHQPSAANRALRQQGTSSRPQQRQQESIALQDFGGHQRQGRETNESTAFSEGTTSGKSAQEKRQVKNKIKSDFDIDDVLINAALEAADYNEKRTRDVLKQMGYKTKAEENQAAKAKPKATSSTSTGTRAETSPRHTSTVKYEEMKVTDFSALYKDAAAKNAATKVPTREEDRRVQDQGSSRGQSASSTRINSARVSSPVAVSRSDIRVTIASSASATSRSNLSSAQSSKSVSGIIGGSRPESSALKKLMTKPPRSREYTKGGTTKSLLKTPATSGKSGLAKGPDKSLFMGPEPKFLLSEFTNSRGPDGSLRHGPRKEYVSTSRVQRLKRQHLAVGPNQALCKGPDRSLASGPRVGVSCN